MLISHSHKFIFVHNYKVGGTSINTALMPYASPLPNTRSIFFKLLNSSQSKIQTPEFKLHIKAYQLKEKLPAEVFNNYFKFGFVRNPWDWQVSLYNYILKEKNHYQHELIKGMKNFDEFIDWRINKHLRFQKEFFYDKEGNLLVDYVGKYETLIKDFNYICDRIGIKASLPHVNKSKEAESIFQYYSDKTTNLVYKVFSRISPRVQVKVSLPPLNQERKKDGYLKYYNEKTIDLVYEAYKEDIEAFGYSKPVLLNTSANNYRVVE